MNIVQKILRSEERGATPESVAETLRSKDPSRIQGLMSEHRVYAQSGPQSTQRYDVNDRTATSGDVWRPGGTLGWLRPHRVRQFELNARAEEPEHKLQTLHGSAIGRSVDASFVPMTTAAEWDGHFGNIGTALSRTRTVNLGEGELGVTGEMTGCSLVRKTNGSIGHLQPPRKSDDPHKPLTGVRAEEKLLKQSTVASVFGPIEYGRQRGTTHERTNAIMIGGSAQTKVVSQSFFSFGELERRDRRNDVTESHKLGTVTTTRGQL